MNKVWASGAGGLVGARIMTQLAGRYDLGAFPKWMLAAADESAVAELVWHEQPDVILHTAAISDTGYSEKHPEESYRANVELPLWVARRKRWLSPQERVTLDRDWVGKLRPTDCKPPRRARRRRRAGHPYPV